MTDFEDRLTSALRSAGDDAPDATGLAPAARRRAGVRRRRTALTSAAAVVAVVGVVGAVALLGDGDAGTNRTTVASEPTPTQRVETWHDVSVTVPTAWGHGSMSTWCIAGPEPSAAVVERPGGAVEDILCTPATGYGVRFSDGGGGGWEAYGPGTVNESVGDDLPSGSWQGWDAVEGARVDVVAQTRVEAEQVLESFERFSDADANGCTPHPVDPGPVAAAGTLLLCRYGVDDWLEESELLTGQDAEHAQAALEAAPAKGDRMCTMELTGPVVMAYSAETQGRVTLDACHGFVWAGEEHDLTSDVLYWVLSPGWTGGVEGDVPMPDRLRQ